MYECRHDRNFIRELPVKKINYSIYHDTRLVNTGGFSASNFNLEVTLP